MDQLRPRLIEFPADDPQRALRFWHELLGRPLEPRSAEQGEGWESAPDTGPAVGIHPRGRGPGDTFSLPYFEVDDVEQALDSVRALGGTVVHPGESWAVCKDSEGTPFGLAARSADVPRDIPIRGEMIRLGQLLKLAGVADTGGEARALVAEARVRVNGAPETRHGRQLKAGDTVTVGELELRVAGPPD